ncbi:MAG: response regulator, partial [Lachnospiraceae bacterium]|nr:response regulator [Lachnospiraceae bacterium]
RILLVEDNSFNREIARMFLLEEGFVIEEAVDGKIALEKVKTTVKPYDLILMDIQMPVMDGYEATQQIRRLSNSMLANIPIVAMTANAFEEEKKKALECGMNGHIAKPINVTVLFETIKQMLQ